MSDSGFSGLPPGPRTGDASFPQSLIELKAKIIELRGELKVQRVRERLEGEIIRHNPDGTTRIRTEKGEITVELRGRDPPPPGTKVEVEIPPGNPPRQVIIRPAPEQPAQPAPPAAQPRTPQTPQPERSPPRADSQQPANIPASRPAPRLDAQTAEDLARHLLKAPPRDPAAPAIVRTEDIIRLLPLPPQEILRPEQAIVPAQITKLPQLPQITLPTNLFEDIGALLTVSPAEPLLRLHDLPTHLPVFAQATREPFAGFIFEPASGPSFMAATQFIQTILNMNQRDAQTPVLIAPATAAAETLPPRPPASGGAGGGEAPQLVFSNSPNVFSPAASFDVRIQTIVPPAVKLLEISADKSKPVITHMPSVSIPAALAGTAGNLTGEVTGITPQNIPVLSFFTPGAAEPLHFIMQFPAANLPPGTQVQIMPLPGAAPMQTAAVPPFIPFEFFSEFGWPAMEEIARTLQQTAPQAAQVLSNMAVNAATPARVPAAALFFIAAIRSGDISSWLGDKTVDALRRAGKGELLSRLTRDAGGLQRSEAQPPGEWRASALPMMWDGQMHKMMLYYRHDGKGGSEGEEGKRGTRFVFDLNLTRMGDVQLDGLHRPQQGRKGKLDLIVRTKNALSPSMQQHMRRTYIEALEQADLTGELSFQNKPGQFIKIEMQKRQEQGS